MSAELMPLWSGALCVCLAALNANAAVLGADGTHGLAGSQRDRGAVDLCGGGVAVYLKVTPPTGVMLTA